LSLTALPSSRGLSTLGAREPGKDVGGDKRLK
jgi:hypothetical protein